MIRAYENVYMVYKRNVLAEYIPINRLSLSPSLSLNIKILFY